MFAAAGGWFFFVADLNLALPSIIALGVLRAGPSLLDSSRTWLRVVGWAFAAFLITANVLALLLIAAYGPVMAWHVPTSARALTAALTLLCLLGPRRTFGVRVPIVLPIAVWGAACLADLWPTIGTRVECDDYLALPPGVRVLVPVRRDLAACHSGEVLPIGRFPRHVWEMPDGRVLFTSQSADAWTGPLQAVDTVTGLICESPRGGTDAPLCLGGEHGKSQGIVDAPELNQVFVGAWNVPAGGELASIVMTVARNGPLRLLEWHEVIKKTPLGGDLVYDPAGDRVWLFSDQFTSEIRRASDFSVIAGERPELSLLDHRYDPVSGDGVICGFLYTGGPPFATIASFRGVPPERRDIVSTQRRPYLLAGLPTGCELDAVGRQIYASLINLGLVVAFDYDSGEWRQTFWLRPGIRALQYDARRRWLFVANYPTGMITALDVASGERRGEWFAGRFCHGMHLTRDGRNLLVSSNLGVTAIDLPAS